MDNYKEETKKTYDKYSSDFDLKFKKHFDGYLLSFANFFINNLSGKDVLDLGSGPGNHAVYFKEKGLDVLCLDISEKMIEKCQEKGLKGIVGDIESLSLDDRYDGIWAYAALLHVPRKNIPSVVSNIAKLLKPKGFLAIAVKEGVGEGFETHEKYPETKRWFTYFSDEEIRSFFSRDFDLIETSKTNVKDKYVFLNYLFRLK